MAMPVVALPLAFILFSNKGAIPGGELVVHEWGTFTTLAGSDGGLLNGLYLDEEPLPDFVFQYQTVPETIKNQRGKGVAFEPTHVNVKMETPVLYLYSPHPLHASVRVDFPRGLISQWYPSCSRGNNPPAGNTPAGGSGGNQDLVKAVDFTTPVNGFMKWEPDILAPGTQQTISHPGGSHTWNTPRQTDANLLSVKNGSREDVEKFIFYRGIANFTPPVRARFMGGAEGSPIEITNAGKQDLPYVLVYEKKGNGDAIIYWQGAVKGGEKQSVDHREGKVADFAEFEKGLMAAGLYPKEAKAMLATWKNSYFGNKGIRIFWIAPEEWLNAILPLHINPQPREIKRVFVGRYELLSPAFETSLLKGWQKNGGLLPDGKEVARDRYHLAYAELVQRRAGRP